MPALKMALSEQLVCGSFPVPYFLGSGPKPQFAWLQPSSMRHGQATTGKRSLSYQFSLTMPEPELSISSCELVSPGRLNPTPASLMSRGIDTLSVWPGRLGFATVAT